MTPYWCENIHLKYSLNMIVLHFWILLYVIRPKVDASNVIGIFKCLFHPDYKSLLDVGCFARGFLSYVISLIFK